MDNVDVYGPTVPSFSEPATQEFNVAYPMFSPVSSDIDYFNYAILGATVATMGTIALSTSIYGFKRTAFYIRRKVINPLDRKFSKIKNRFKLANFFNRAKDPVINPLGHNSDPNVQKSKESVKSIKDPVINPLGLYPYSNVQKSINNFISIGDILKRTMSESLIEDDLEAAFLNNATFEDMLTIFREKKEQKEKLYNNAIKSGRDCLNILNSYLKITNNYNSDKVDDERRAIVKREIIYIQRQVEIYENTLRPNLDPKIKTTRDELINHLNNWNPANLEAMVSTPTLQIDRELLTTRPKISLAKILNVGLPFSQLSFRILNEPAVDGGGVTREVYTKLFSSLLEESDGSNRSILKLSPYLYVYKGLGVALRQIANNQTLFLKDYFNRELFSLIDGLTVDELTIIFENIDLSAIELIKQRVILGLHPSEAFGLNQIFRYKNKTEKTTEDIKEIREFFEESFDYTGDDIDGEINKWLEQHHYYTNADRLIAIAMYFKGVAQTVNDPSLIDSVKQEELELRASGVNSLDRIQTPLNRQNLADAIILGSVHRLSSEEISCLEEKCRLIKSWITKKSTSEKMLFDFTVFCTGSALLGAGQNIIISYGEAPFHAHTCFNRLDLSTRFERGDDQTLEQGYEAFIRDLEYVIEPNTGAAFNSD